MLVLTLLPFIRSDAWWVRIFDFPRAQIAVIAAAVAAAYPFFVGAYGPARYAFLAALASCVVYQSYRMFPYTPLARRQVQQSRRPREGSSLALLFANVLMENRDASRLCEIIREADPDILLAIETDEWWQGQLMEFEESHPFTVLQPQGNTYGMLFYSRLELVSAEVKFLVQDDIPSIHARVRLASGQEVELHCLHPRPPFPTEDERSTERDAELLIVGKAIKGKDDPVVVLGDLNDVAWSRTNDLFQHISGLLDPRKGRGFYNTFHAKYPFIRFPLDHFFHSRHFRVADFRRLTYFGSDHFPVYIQLSYEPDAEAEQEKPRADESEKEEARETIGKAVG
ncbi:MAG TPA: endonuclease/exonuclease/phosphatase family protein [Pyrinomonadaceae bacterium]